MGRGAGWIVVLVSLVALAAVPSAGALAPPTGWDGANPFNCELQYAGFGTVVPHPDADPYCVDFDKRRQNITELGIADFLSKEPARVAAAVGKCFYFQSDHWRASVIQDDGSTKLYEWDGHYFFDRARAEGGVWVTNFNIDGRTADPSALPGMPPDWAQFFGPGTGGVITHDDIPADPSCAGRSDVYAKPAPAAEPAPPLAPCADASGPVTHRSIGPLTLGMTQERARRRLGEPRASGRGFAQWCTLRATLRRGRIVRLRTSSPIYTFHGIHPGGHVRWRSGTHRIGHDLVVGVRGHRVRWLACARAS